MLSILNLSTYQNRMKEFKTLTFIFLFFATSAFASNLCQENCQLCDPDGQCQACAVNYELDMFGQCISDNTVEGCISYGPQMCFFCRPTYRVQDFKCIKMNDGCLQGQKGKCYQCGYGTVTVDGKCKGVLNCEMAGESCSKCRQGFRLEGNKCVTSREEGCAEVNQSNGSCMKCADGYFLSQFRCFQNKYEDPLCYYRYDQQNCEFCKTGYLGFEGVCLTSQQFMQIQNGQKSADDFKFRPVEEEGSRIAKQIPNCSVVDPQDPTSCLICVYGFYPKGEICVKVSSLCDAFNVENGMCFTCKYGLTLSNGKCKDKNCMSFKDETCVECSNGYSSNSNGICERKDPYCSSSVNGKCQQCKKGYYVRTDGVCYQLPPNCQIANIVNGDCLECAKGFQIVLPGRICQKKAEPIKNCEVPSPQNAKKCLICVYGYYPSAHQCKKVSALCGDHNVQNGNCITCLHPAMDLINGKCFDPKCLTPGEETCGECLPGYTYSSQQKMCKENDKKQPPIPNCLNSDDYNKRCLVCADRYYPLDNGCKAVAKSCEGYHPQSGACTTCKIGYKIQGTSCIAQNQVNQSTVTENSDAHCLEFSEGSCRRCSVGYYVFELDKKCIPVNPLCKASNDKGHCTECYSGYKVQGGECMVAKSQDPNCKTFNGQACSECFSGYFFNLEYKICKRLNPLCKTSDISNGHCLTCYPGYRVNERTGNCEVSFKDPNCVTFDDDVCTGCSDRFYLKGNKCSPVNPLCNGYDPKSGYCTTCYPGYSLSSGKCQKGGSLQPNCKQFLGDSCVVCFSGFFVFEGKCKEINPLCRTSNPATGACTSCYPGYQIALNQCRINDARDKNCKSYDHSNNNFCIDCYKGFLAIGGICQRQNPLCKEINKFNGNCTSCWRGYELIQGNCQPKKPESSVAEAASDIYCIKVEGKVCLQCSNGYYLNSKDGKCKRVDPLCREHDPDNGQCTSCYTGYQVFKGSCIMKVAVQIPNCMDVNSDGKCEKCIESYYLVGQTCKVIPLVCSKFNAGLGKCLQCIPGYFLQNNQCIYPALPDPNCIYYESSYCSKCRHGFYLQSYTCHEVGPDCLKFNYERKACEQCRDQMVAKGARCW